MNSVLVERDHDTLLARFRKLTPEHRPLWGRLSVREMVCHLADQLAVALGDIQSEPRRNVLMQTVAKWFVLYVPFPTPKGRIKTVPEMLTTQPSIWGEDTARFESLLSRLANAEHVFPHSIFGGLSHKQWGILAAKHIDHHLQQFGL